MASKQISFSSAMFSNGSCLAFIVVTVQCQSVWAGGCSKGNQEKVDAVMGVTEERAECTDSGTTCDRSMKSTNSNPGHGMRGGWASTRGNGSQIDRLLDRRTPFGSLL